MPGELSVLSWNILNKADAALEAVKTPHVAHEQGTTNQCI